MTLGRLGVWYSTDKLNGSQLADLVGVVEKAGYSALWYPESRGYESMSLAGYLLSKSTRLTIGSSRPTMRPTSRAQRPPALTTCSAWMVPFSVITSSPARRTSATLVSI